MKIPSVASDRTVILTKSKILTRSARQNERAGLSGHKVNVRTTQKLAVFLNSDRWRAAPQFNCPTVPCD